MRFLETPLDGAWVLEPERRGDERGWFARTYDADVFAERGLPALGVQCNASFNAKRDTLRGMHYQRDPDGEPKLVRCSSGAVWDVAVDLRRGSPSYLRWFGVELSPASGRGFFIPTGCAHGFQTLTEDCELQYMMGHRYVPGAATGVRWDDPAFGIEWPAPSGERTMTERDRTWPDFTA
ncbi:MAG: dTDP-4-dehydrorhamnose 3,5-epimerase [Solirubrobacteraceae bacterium]|nr:dTDP-4-dehydrorhamnose 3,5-epimerase [Solirubrobacteraceae bacterium]